MNGPESAPAIETRHDWTTDEALAVMERPFHDLLFDAQRVHRAAFRPDTEPTDL